VTANLNFKQVEKLEERYDPEATVVRSEQRIEQKDGSTTTSTSGSGVPGVQSATGKAAPAAAGGTSVAGGGSKRDETLNYEVSRSTAKIVEPVGALNKLSVAIMVDGKYEAPATPKSGASAQKPKYVPRSPEELQKIEALVKSAVGFNAERGDQLSVVNVPFQETGEEGTAEAPKIWEKIAEKPIVSDVLKNALLGVAFLALIFLVIRPLMKMVPAPRRDRGESFEPLGSHGADTYEKLDGGGKAAQLQEGIDYKGQTELLAVVKQDPYQTAQIIQNWLRQRD
jgi:flagellar M-ring protein FliF